MGNYISDGLHKIKDKISDVIEPNRGAGANKSHDAKSVFYDLHQKVINDVSVIEEEHLQTKRKYESTSEICDLYQQLFVQMEEIEQEHLADNEPAVFLDATKNAQLHYTKLKARLNMIHKGNQSEPVALTIVHELTSLSFTQLFTLGVGFFAPLIIALVVAAIIVVIGFAIALS